MATEELTEAGAKEDLDQQFLDAQVETHYRVQHMCCCDCRRSEAHLCLQDQAVDRRWKQRQQQSLLMEAEEPGAIRRPNRSYKEKHAKTPYAKEQKPKPEPKVDLRGKNAWVNPELSQAKAQETTEEQPKKAAKPCWFYSQGKCTKGDECPFSHEGVPAPQIPAKSKRPCHFYSQGKCTKGDACPFSHEAVIPANKTWVAPEVAELSNTLPPTPPHLQGTAEANIVVN